MAERGFRFREPIKGQELEFRLLPLKALRVSPYQRQLSAGLVQDLAGSVSEGFLVPLVVVEDPDGEGFLVVDGQHRLEALKRFRWDEEVRVPCIVVPEEWLYKPLHFNREKADNLRDRAAKVYQLVQDLVLTRGREPEDEVMGPVVAKEPWLLACAFAMAEMGLRSPSLVEPFGKRFMNELMALPLEEAVKERKEQARGLKDLEDLVQAIAEKYGVKDFNLKKSILTTCIGDLWGRKRLVDEEWREALAKLMNWIGGKDWSWLAKANQ